MRIASTGLRILLGLMFLYSAISKIAGLHESTREDLQIASWFWQLTGVIELVGAVALLASLWYVHLALPAGIWLVGLMIGAVAAHIRVDDPVSMIVVPAALLVLSAVIAVLGYQQAWVSNEMEEPAGGRSNPQST